MREELLQYQSMKQQEYMGKKFLAKDKKGIRKNNKVFLITRRKKNESINIKF